MHCLLIEDRTELLPEFVSMLERQKGIEAVHTAMHPYQVRYILKNIPIGLVICTPQLWNHSYFDGIKRIPQLLFTSNNKAKIKEDLDVSPLLNIIREPWNALQLESMISKLKVRKFVEEAEFLFIRYERRWRAVRFKDIELIEKKQASYVLICCKTNNYLVAGSLNTWIQRLPEGKFVRPCDNLIVPFSEAGKFGGDTYLYRGRTIGLTFRMAKQARKELELH